MELAVTVTTLRHARIEISLDRNQNQMNSPARTSLKLKGRIATQTLAAANTIALNISRYDTQSTTQLCCQEVQRAKTES